MMFCANCGERYEVASGVCPCCCLDQAVPEEIIDARLKALRQLDGPLCRPMFGYPGERAALYVSVASAFAVLAFLGAVTFGIVLLAVAVNVLFLIATYWSERGRMMHVSKASFPKIHRISKVAAYRLGTALPPVFITESPSYNAYTTGFLNRGWIVLHSALVRDFDPDELLFVIGHELGHMRKHHTTWLTLMGPTHGVGSRFVLAPVMRLIFNVWSVKSEYSADQAGLIACRNPTAAILTMLKLAAGADVAKNIDVSKVIEPAGYEPEIGSSLLEYLGTHPFVVNRIRQLVNFSSSPAYESVQSEYSY